MNDQLCLEPTTSPKTPRVSIVMANYNYARFLPQAIESVQKQSFGDWELIVVDDGSTDESRQVIESYLTDRRIRFRPVEHLGQAGAKNAGLEWCRGPLIAFLDADDVWHPEKLARQVERFDRDPSLGLVCTRRRWIDPDGRELNGRCDAPLHRGQVLSELLRDNFVCFSSAMVRRLVLEHVGWFDPITDLAIDYDLWLRVATHYRFDYVDEPLVLYRCGHGNLSKRVGERLQIATLILRRFVHRDGHRVAVSEIAEAQAATWHHLGIAYRPHSLRQSARWLCRSLRAQPRRRATWRSLASLLVPYRMRRWVRRVLRRDADWEEAYRSSAADSPAI